MTCTFFGLLRLPWPGRGIDVPSSFEVDVFFHCDEVRGKLPHVLSIVDNANHGVTTREQVSTEGPYRCSRQFRHKCVYTHRHTEILNWQWFTWSSYKTSEVTSGCLSWRTGQCTHLWTGFCVRKVSSQGLKSLEKMVRRKQQMNEK